MLQAWLQGAIFVHTHCTMLGIRRVGGKRGEGPAGRDSSGGWNELAR